MENSASSPNASNLRDRGAVKAWMIGGGIGSQAAAAFMIRDGGVPGANITILESLTEKEVE